MEPFAEVLLGILGIVGIIALGAFIIICIADLLLYIIDGGRNGILFRRRSDEVSSSANTTTIIREEREVRKERVSDGRPLVLEDNGLDKDYTAHDGFDFASTTTTKTKGYDEDLALNEQQALMSSSSSNTIMMNDEEVHEREFKQERSEVVEKRRREFEELDSLFEEDEEEDDELDEAEAKRQDEYIEAINAKSVAEYKSSSTIAEPIATIDVVEENVKVAEAEVEAITTEIKETEEEVKEASIVVSSIDEAEREEFESAKVALETERKKLEELRMQLIEEKTYLEEERVRLVRITQMQADTETDTDGGMRFSSNLTLDEINANLEKLRMRLKVNEKELKANKKEFLPLSRVNRTLENDKKKLRRREAIVAKQKVVLYGVNNYIDIDEEKAKKLSEELDLLDGLRLSVQHCEEVMQANKERFPILENTNHILTEQNKQLKGDIAELEVKLALLLANGE